VGQKDKMGASEDFLLKWNDHHSLFFAGAEELCESEEYTDVTLAAGQKFFSAHKLVLSICSPYFRSLFKRLGSNVKSVIFLKDVDPKHLELLLEYMYKGEIKVQEQELVNVLNAAQSLEIKGLTDNGQSSSSESNKSNPPKAEHKPHHSSNKRSSPAPEPVRKRPKPQPTVVEPSPSVITPIAPPPAVLNVKEEQEVIPVPDEEEEGAWSEDQQGTGYTEPAGGYHSSTVATGYEEMGYDEGGEDQYYGEDGMVNIEGGEGDDRMLAMPVEEGVDEFGLKSWKCSVCGHASRNRANLYKHQLIHSGHKPYACTYCYKSFADASNRNRHVRTLHANEPSLP